MFIQNLKRTVAIASLLLASSGSLYAQFGGVQVSVGVMEIGIWTIRIWKQHRVQFPLLQLQQLVQRLLQPLPKLRYNNTSMYGGYYNNSSYYPVRSYNTVAMDGRVTPM